MLNRSSLYAYQRRAIEHIKEHDACALFVDCGLGKTVSTLTAFADLLRELEVRRMLVVAPLRVARKVWADEVAQWAHLQGLSVARIVGTPEERMRALRTPADIHTINREQLLWLHAQFIQGEKQIVHWPWEMVVLDESTSFKASSSKRWEAMRALRKLARRVVLLTGTPIPNGYHDLWAQFALLDRGRRLGHTLTAFRERWFERPLRSNEFDKWTVRQTSIPEIQRAIGDITLSLRAEDYLDLPDVVYNFVRVQLAPTALATYNRMAREYIAEVKGKTLTAVSAGALDGKLLQLANGTVYTGDGREYVEFHDEKVEALKELLETLPRRVLVAYYYRHDLDRIKRLLGAQDRPWAVLRTDAEFDAWAAGKYEVGVLHPASAGHGLNDVYKSGAEDLVHYGLSANLELYIQVNDRLAGGHRRLGRNVKIHHIVAEQTRDDDYVALLRRKAYTQDECTKSLAAKIREAP